MSILRKLKNKIVDDLIPNELKSPAGAAAAAIAFNQFGIPGTMGKGVEGGRIGQGSISRGLASIFGGRQPDVSQEMSEVSLPIPGQKETLGSKIRKTAGNIFNTKVGGDTVGGKILSGILSPAGLSIGAGLLAGAFAKEDDPLYTGQNVGLNLRDIRKLANISDPRTGAAIGLNFLPETRFRQFSPEQMAETFAATAPKDFTEDRTPAQEGGIMGDQKDFEQFLQDMKERDMGRMQDQILRDFQKYMERKKMIEQMPEAKDGGIMKAKPKMAGYGYDDAMSDTFDMYNDMKKNGLIPPTMTFDEFLQEVVPEMSKKKGIERTMAAEGGMMDMGGMEMDLRGGGFVPMGRAEKADDVPARLSKNEFVFTADAVRAAGGGDVDKGADKMYATMKKLEDRVA